MATFMRLCRTEWSQKLDLLSDEEMFMKYQQGKQNRCGEKATHT